jgi:hypothetical protein
MSAHVNAHQATDAKVRSKMTGETIDLNRFKSKFELVEEMVEGAGMVRV